MILKVFSEIMINKQRNILTQRNLVFWGNKRDNRLTMALRMTRIKKTFLNKPIIKQSHNKITRIDKIIFFQSLNTI